MFEADVCAWCVSQGLKEATGLESGSPLWEVYRNYALANNLEPVAPLQPRMITLQKLLQIAEKAYKIKREEEYSHVAGGSEGSRAIGHILYELMV